MQTISKYMISVLSIFYLGCAQTTYAQDLKLDAINLTLSVKVTEKTCGVLSTAQDKKIELGTIRLGKGMNKDDRSPRVQIPFDVSSCPANGLVTITFTGTNDTVDTQLLAIDNVPKKAKNVAIEISDKDKNRVVLGTKSKPITADANGNASLMFYANYIVTKDTAEPGIGNAKMQFSVQYE
ncbi:fimbrial protein [Acinetobacter bereziniae]|uniref:fimbrial protein n=1 Tax=Acinetobacter bereziniae TaxID=106648 RepID=UPI001904C10E|nr:fimbrial protein [Acinetobacter bereziniae]MDG3557526.1 fimbrial protein [Acinetobacter bereziniae]MDP6002748.1 fimbrial protein [Acinetobacter bereziniae]QQC79532.1 fimbrial protein [Acinetobacter bereziniae]UUN92610.1 fimbrial protein [Acinetobacter bereziniae]